MMRRLKTIDLETQLRKLPNIPIATNQSTI
jgi:hypothetical protein